MSRALVAALLLLTPSLALAAGFADQTIFLSRNPVSEGDTVRIYAVLTNTATTTFVGSVVIQEAGQAIGSVPVSLAAGATQTASVPWSPIAGTHTIVAQLIQGGTVAQEKSADFTINPRPVVAPAVPQPTAVDSSESIRSSITSVVPQASGVVTPVFGALDSVRSSIADVTDKQLAATKPKLEHGEVAGAETERSSMDWLWNIVYTVYFYILTLVRFVVGSAAVFYPVFAVAFLYFLYKMFRLFGRRPSY